MRNEILNNENDEKFRDYLRLLRRDAPLTTRDDVNIKTGPIDQYFFPESLIDSSYNDGIYPVDEITINKDKSDIKAVLAHELTHAYIYRFAKEARGFAKLAHKMKKNPELEEKLGTLAKSLKEKSVDIKYSDSKVKNCMFGLDEAISHACERPYREHRELPDNAHPEAFRKGRLEACDDLVGILGIDGARAFVRDVMREIYTTEKVIPIKEKVKEYKEAVRGFFDSIENP